MHDAKTLGRIVGALLLIKLALGPVQNFTLMSPVVAAPGFLVNAAAHPMNLPLAVMIAFALCFATVAIAALAWPLFRRVAPGLAFAFVAFSVVGVATTLVECMTMMSMQSLSFAFKEAAGADPALYDGLRIVVGKARNWAHWTNLMTGGVALFTMFLLMYRARLVPRAICGFGMVAVLAQLYSLGLPFFGGAVDFNLLAPLGLAYLALVVWLVWRGFPEPEQVRSVG